MIKIEVQSTRAVIRYQAPLTVGLRGAKAQFTFGRDWDGLTKTAVFRQGDKTVAVADIGDTVTIPWEVLTVPGVPVQIGVYGIDGTGDIAIPTVWAVTQPVRPGTDPEGDPSTEPTPELWEQMQGKLGSLEQLDTNDQSSLVAAVNEANRAVYVVTVNGTEGSYSTDCSMPDLLKAWKAGKTLLCLWKEHSRWMSVCRAIVNETAASTFEFSAVWGNQVFWIRLKGMTGAVAVSHASQTDLATEESKLPNPKKLTIIGTETAKYDGSEEVAVEIPTKVSQLTNDQGYLTKAPVTSVNGQTGAVKLPAPLKVTIEELASGVVQSDPPYEELAELRNEGHLLYCQHGSLELPLVAVTPFMYIFSCVQGGKVHTVMVGQSSVTVTDTPLASGSGIDGITPHIGDNGNWFIGETDTGLPSRGEEGITPHIGDNGNWFIGETDTGLASRGEEGITPHIGDNGNWFIGETDTGMPSRGEEGITPHIGDNGNWFIGETDTGLPSCGEEGITPHIGDNGNWFIGETDTRMPSRGEEGKTPVKGLDYWTDADQEAIVQQVITALGTPLFGSVDADNIITLNGDLADGAYTLKYEDADGNTVPIGTIVIGGVPVVSLVWLDETKLDKTTGAESTDSNYFASDYVELVSGYTYTVGRSVAPSQFKVEVMYYKADKSVITSNVELAWDNDVGDKEAKSFVMTPPSDAAYFRLRGYDGANIDTLSLITPTIYVNVAES